MNVPLNVILQKIAKQNNSFNKTEFIKMMKEKHNILKNNHTFILPNQIEMKIFPGDLFRYGDENFISGLCIVIKIEYKKEKNLNTSMIDKYIDYIVVKTGDIYKKLYINNYFVFKYNRQSHKMANIQKIFKIKNDNLNDNLNNNDSNEKKYTNIKDVFDFVDDLVKKHDKK